MIFCNTSKNSIVDTGLSYILSGIELHDIAVGKGLSSECVFTQSLVKTSYDTGIEDEADNILSAKKHVAITLAVNVSGKNST